MNQTQYNQSRLKCAVHMDGQDVTLVAVGAALDKALRAAQKLHTRGLSAYVIEVRSDDPADMQVIVAAAMQTGCLVLAAPETSARKLEEKITQQMFGHDPLPVLICAMDAVGQDAGENRIFDKALQAIASKGHFTSSR